MCSNWDCKATVKWWACFTSSYRGRSSLSQEFPPQLQEPFIPEQWNSSSGCIRQEWPRKGWSSLSFVFPHLGAKLRGKESKIFTAVQFSIKRWTPWKFPHRIVFHQRCCFYTTETFFSGKHGFHPELQWIITGIFTFHNSIITSKWNNIGT